MAASDKKDDQVKDTADTNAGPSDDDQVNAFWDEFNKRLDERLDQFFDRKKKEITDNSRSRNGGRTTMHGFLADVMFGPSKKD